MHFNFFSDKLFNRKKLLKIDDGKTLIQIAVTWGRGFHNYQYDDVMHDIHTWTKYFYTSNIKFTYWEVLSVMTNYYCRLIVRSNIFINALTDSLLLLVFLHLQSQNYFFKYSDTINWHGIFKNNIIYGCF